MQTDKTQRAHSLHDRISSRPGDVIPPLYEPELVAIGAGALLLRGFESADGVGYVQEWRCEVTGY